MLIDRVFNQFILLLAMSITVIPTSRWISLTISFPGLGTVSRDRNIHKPVVCEDKIGQRLISKFFAKLYEEAAVEKTTTESLESIETEAPVTTESPEPTETDAPATTESLESTETEDVKFAEDLADTDKEDSLSKPKKSKPPAKSH